MNRAVFFVIAVHIVLFLFPFVEVMLFVLLATTDTDVQHRIRGESADSLRMHDALLLAVFEDISSSLVRFLSFNEPQRKVCAWRQQGFKSGTVDYFHIVCEWNEIKSFEVLNIREQGNYKYAYAPHSARVLHIENCDQFYQLETRLLPKSAVSISLARNVIYGTIDLQSLPPNLESIDLHDNAISGRIHLFKLPRTLKNIRLADNKIKQSVLYFADLPESLSLIDLRRNEVRSVRQLLKVDDSPGFSHLENIFKGAHVHPM